MLSEVTEVRVGDDGDLLDVSLMIADEPDVGDQRAEAVPAREVGCVNDQAGQIAALLDDGIDGVRQFGEVGLVQGVAGRTRTIELAWSNSSSITIAPCIRDGTIIAPPATAREEDEVIPRKDFRSPAGGTCHRIAPGFRMPSGSSAVLTRRFSSRASGPR